MEKLNKGELFEFKVTSKFGFEWTKDNLKYNEGSDIEQLKMSVKFGKASIMSTKLNIKASECDELKRIELIKEFINTVASESFLYGYCMEYGYKMDKKTFEKFLKLYSKLDNDSKTKTEKETGISGKLKLRLKEIPKAERKWLDRNAERINLE